MSAKETYRKPPINIEILPDELLGEVLRHATWVPYGIDPSDLVYKPLQSSRSRDIAREYRLSLVTRRYLIQACKKWYRLALLYLYEWLLVRKAKNLQGIVLAAEASLSGADDTRIGWCTRRIDIDIHWTGGETHDHVANVGPLLLRLLQAVPNLEVLTTGNCPDYSWMYKSVSHSYCTKLSTFNWFNGTKVLDPESWYYFLHSHPNLTYINPPTTTAAGQYPPKPPLTHTLLGWTTGEFSPIPINTCFTSLQRLNINIDRPFFFADPLWYGNLITQPIPSLDTLQINIVSYFGKVNPDLDLKTVQHLFHFFPNLRRVDLVFPLWPQPWSGYAFPASVRVLGVRVCSTRPKKQVVSRLLRVLGRIVREAHEPLVVQILDEGTMEDITVHQEYVVTHAKEWNLLESWLDPDGTVYRLPV